ncbi:MAG: hypothetical protein FJZ96_15760 [Chloroflexi bacterium]|nr:hypothetical protein [Chloroflexota bacterium]
MDEKQKKLKRMAVWLIAVFAAVFAIVITIFWQITGGVGLSSIGLAFKYGWPILAVAAALCLVVYFAYLFLVNRKK